MDLSEENINKNVTCLKSEKRLNSLSNYLLKNTNLSIYTWIIKYNSKIVKTFSVSKNSTLSQEHPFVSQK